MPEEATTAEQSRSIRAIKAGCRVALLSQLDKGSALRVLMELERLVTAREDVNVAPVDWIGKGVDTLCLFLGDKLLAAVVVRNIVLADPLVLSDSVARAVSLDLLWSHLAGLLAGQGVTEFFFGLQPNTAPDWRGLLEKDGYSERLGGEKTDFYRKRLLPVIGG